MLETIKNILFHKKYTEKSILDKGVRYQKQPWENTVKAFKFDGLCN